MGVCFVGQTVLIGRRDGKRYINSSASWGESKGIILEICTKVLLLGISYKLSCNSQSLYLLHHQHPI